jgi:hypothetical protein
VNARPDQVGEQVRAALRLLRCADVERVREAITSVNRASASFDQARDTLSSQTKAAVIALQDKMLRVRAVYNALPPMARQHWFADLEEDLTKYEQRIECIFRQHWIAQARQRRFAFRQRLAAHKARQLLEHCGMVATATRGGAFCRLTAVLCGDTSLDTYNACRAHLAERREV